MTETLTVAEYNALSKKERREPMQRPEEELHIPVADLCATILPPEVYWWHTPNQRGGRSRAENQILKAMGVKAGFPDLGFIYDAKAYFIELKPVSKRNQKNGGLSDSQVQCHSDLRAAGCQVTTCYTLIEVEGTLKAWFPVRGKVAA